MHFTRFQPACVLITFLCSVSVSNGLTEEIKCSYKVYPDEFIETNCITTEETAGCPDDQFEIENENAEISLTDCSNAACLVQISTAIGRRGTPILFINGHDLQMKQICIRIIFNSLNAWKGREILISSSNIKLSHGVYSITGYTTDIRGRKLIFARKSIAVGEFPEIHSKSCQSVNCNHFRYEFVSHIGLLRLFLEFENGTTCEKESDNMATLYKLPNSGSLTKEICQSYNNNTDDHDIISRSVRYRKPVEISTNQPLNFANIETGCYIVRVRPGCYFGWFWFISTNNIDLNTWNTSILLIPRENQASIRVQWEWPLFPYNFTNWKLKLWKMEDYPVQCNGKNPMDKKLTTKTPPGLLITNYYTFTNLSDGYYCVRLGGVDPRCQEDGCALRSSGTVLFNRSRSESIERQVRSNGIPIVLLIATGIIVGVCFSVICFRFNWTTTKKTLRYEIVADKDKLVQTPSVLLIWTKYSPINSPNPEPLIQVLKHLLRKYYLCQVFDYLDPLSLPKDQCLQLMSDPTSWLNSHLRKSDVKIIIVASEGAYWRQQEDDPEKIPRLDAQLPNPFDKSLFPYVLNFLQESFKLSADYSRVFQVCFPEVYGHGMELEGLVASARYNMPEHIKELAYRIHGSNDYSTRLMKEPIPGELEELQEAISLMKKLKTEDK